jgi:hypothetical protein
MYKDRIYIWYHICYCLHGSAFVDNGLSRVYNKPLHSGRPVVSILHVKINGEKLKNRDREI